MSNLPEDLIEEIICGVPAIYLKQLRSTCKRWNSLFNNRRFAGKHLSKAAKQFLILMLKESRVCSIRLHGVLPEVTTELNLLDPLSGLGQFEISQVCHCDGLLLCTNEYNTKVVIWNPCTGQTRWIPPNGDCYYYKYNFGSYQDESHHNSYKILGWKNEELAIYEINSNLWRTLDVNHDCVLCYADFGVSVKGKTYWFASDRKEEEQLGVFLLSFDYTAERFGRLRLPHQCPRYATASLTVVRNEKLSVLLQRDKTSKTEIWVSSEIGGTKVVSWSMVLAVDFPPELLVWNGISFVVDEEKKVVLFCDKYFGKDEFDGINLVHIVGEDNEVRQVEFGAVTSSWPFLFCYVPSLVQIQQQRVGGKRKFDE